MQNEDSLITVTDDPIEVTAGRVYSRPVQVGDVVLYTADDTEHCRFGVVDRAAMVTAVEPDCCVSLCAFEPGGFAFVRGARFSVERVSGTWRHRELCACGCRVHERTPPSMDRGGSSRGNVDQNTCRCFNVDSGLASCTNSTCKIHLNKRYG